MSWLDRLRGGFQKTAERVADNLTGIASRAALDSARYQLLRSWASV